MTDSDSHISIVLVDRLKLHCWSAWHDDLLLEVPSAEPIAEYVPEGERELSYDRGRVRYFADLVVEIMDPIIVDQDWHGPTALGPVIIDGWHRFMAHVYKQALFIRASVSGTVDMIDWLTGKSNDNPMDEV